MNLRPFTRGASLAWAILAALLLAACYTVPKTGRSSFNFISAGEETQLGLSSFEEIKRQEKISADPAGNILVQRVGQRIAAAAAEDISIAKWEFVLFENAEPNAFALPGGKVGIYTGILPITRDDAGLAAVMGHEVAHVAARHGGERISQQLALAGLATGLAISLQKQDPGVRNLVLVGFGVGTTLAAVLPHSRMQEGEADRIGLIYMAKAGYPPEEAVAFWERFAEYNRKRGGRPPAFLSTHPTDEKRIADLRAEVPEARRYYAGARAGAAPPPSPR
ncbi:MAG: M48 family metallopeptidase [Verrucomicrobiae bacterium]|nr:M48 family metallopeptidase [Verrucomicrobiae bacterium]